jgi:hypothetical protein
MALTDILPPGPASAINSAASSQWNPVNMVTTGRDYLDTLANNYLVKPSGANGIAGFVFSVAGEANLMADTDITDHYTEYNNFEQDHAALKPIEVMLRGFVGEKILPSPQGINGLLSGIQNKLTTVQTLLGKYSPQALNKVSAVVNSAQNTVNQIDNVIGRAQNIVGLIAGGSAAPTAQAKALAQLMALRDTRQVFTLVTPWGQLAYFNPITQKAGSRSFVIKRLMFEQPENTEDYSDIVVTLKEVRFATVATPNASGGTIPGQTAAEAAQNSSGRLQQQSQAQTNKGNQVGAPGTVTGPLSYFGLGTVQGPSSA